MSSSDPYVFFIYKAIFLLSMSFSINCVLDIISCLQIQAGRAVNMQSIIRFSPNKLLSLPKTKKTITSGKESHKQPKMSPITFGWKKTHPIPFSSSTNFDTLRIEREMLNKYISKMVSAIYAIYILVHIQHILASISCCIFTLSARPDAVYSTAS